MGQSAVAKWKGQSRSGGQPITTFEITSRSGHTAMVDEPPAFGDDLGMRPTEMLLGALGSCTGINALLLLRKFKQPYRDLEVRVEGEQEGEWPHAFTSITITFAITWDGEHDQELVDQALDMACNKYCPVDATLSRGTRIKIEQQHL